MKLFKAMIVVTLAFLINYSAGWTYEKGTESRTPAQDTVTVPASYRYAKVTPVKWLFLGNNYREVWSVPVSMPVFHLQRTKGGFAIEKLGGGQQTRKVHLINLKDSSEWELRSVDKHVTNEALPPKLRNSFASGFVKGIIQDQISAAYPYGLMTLHDLSTAAGVPAPTAELYYVPDDPAFEQYRELFAHSVCFLMPKEIGGKDLETEGTDSIQTLLGKDNRYRVLQERVLQARLFDILIADWDRHKGQWEWAMTDSGHTTYIYPVPEDRDQAYFLSQGFLTFLVKTFSVPHLVGFRKNPRAFKKIANKSHDFDRYFLNDLDRQDWTAGIKAFQARMSDEVIHAAVSKLPPEVYKIDGATIEEKLRARRDVMLERGLEYYDYLSSTVVVPGTATAERFTITSRPNEVEVTVYRTADGSQLYHRVLRHGETSEVLLADVGKEDKVDNKAAKDARVKVTVKERANATASVNSPVKQ